MNSPAALTELAKRARSFRRFQPVLALALAGNILLFVGVPAQAWLKTGRWDADFEGESNQVAVAGTAELVANGQDRVAGPDVIDPADPNPRDPDAEDPESPTPETASDSDPAPTDPTDAPDGDPGNADGHDEDPVVEDPFEHPALPENNGLPGPEVTDPAPAGQDDEPSATIAFFSIRNPRSNELEVAFAVDDDVFTLKPGEQRFFLGAGTRRVRFHRGGDLGREDAAFEAGAYAFVVDRSAGWRLVPETELP